MIRRYVFSEGIEVDFDDARSVKELPDSVIIIDIK